MVNLLLRVHPRDLHVAAGWDHADPVLRLADLPLQDHRPEEQREPLDPHADGLGRGKVARLVQDDQRREPQDRQEIRHLRAVCQAPRVRNLKGGTEWPINPNAHRNAVRCPRRERALDQED